MSLIEVKCIDQTLSVMNSPVIASGDVQTDKVRFEFCPMWDGLVKTAVFYRDEKNAYSVLLDEKNECIVPKEVLQEEGLFYFGVFGVKDDSVKTSEVLRYRVRKGAITEDTKIPDPTPDIYTQILSKMESLGLIITYITNSEIDAIVEV